MTYSKHRTVLLGAIFLSSLCVSQSSIAADMDKVLFSDPVRYDPAEVERATQMDNNVSGFAEASYANGKGESGGFDADGNRWALRGSVNTRLDTSWNVQIDGLYSRMSVDPVDVDTLMGAAHAYYRVPDAYAVGAFIQGSRFGSNILDYLVPFGADKYAVDFVGGGEAAVYTDLATFYAQLGFGQLSYMSAKGDHLLAKLGTRLYATDNLRLDVEGSLNRFSGYGGEANLYTVSAIGNYRFSQFPATVFGGYQYDHGEVKAGGTSLGEANAHTFLAGLRFHFGSDSLKDEERNGPVWSSSALNL